MDKPAKPITKPLKPLTRKQAAFVKHLVDNPKASATEAAAQSYEVKNRGTAEVIAYENLRKPQIVSELAKYNSTIEDTLFNTVVQWGTSDKVGERSVALDTAKFIHDKVNGKAVQRSDVNTTTVTVSLDLTGQSA